ncbi:hypothetical protein [Plesiomonas sp. ZOR0011]|uniref:hypothetical protein n=1 Tax=Plesiomonas sp. ZOR0011 TaxID=1339230 RepID=UPI0012E07706|nr:hypothetical protein [Plesiomonas sp. ZOR0011]
MSQNVDNILNAISKLSMDEKLELFHRVSESNSGRPRPMGENYGNRHQGANTINFAPRTGGKCPACGK